MKGLLPDLLNPARATIEFDKKINSVKQLQGDVKLLNSKSYVLN